LRAQLWLVADLSWESLQKSMSISYYDAA
jgi:hypothetical protein